MSNLKYNINKLHGLLLKEFNEVKIEEKSSIEFGYYFQISVNEDKEVKFIVSKREMENDNFNWKYFSNPLEENSFLVERKSNIDTMVDDIKEILIKNRFDEDYLTKIGK